MENKIFESQLELVHTSTSGPRPTSQFDLVEEGKKIGMLQLRHTRNAPSIGMPESFGNNIYYEIDSDFQRKGYGKKILALGLDEARKIGLKDVRLTVFEDNIPSQKIVEANGGKMIDKQLNTERNIPVRLYEIKL